MARFASLVCLLLGACRAEEACDHEDASLLVLRQATPRARLALPVRLECPETPGIYWSVNGVNSSAADFANWQPLEVASGTTVDVLVCGMDGMGITGLLEGVGAGARVRVAVRDSFNLVVAGNVNHSGALLPTLVRGSVLPGARLGVELTDSGNIRGVGSLRLAGPVMAPLLAGDHSGCRVRVVLRRCGNVELGGAGQVDLMSGSSLLDSLFDVGAVRTSELVVRVSDSGNVEARSLRVLGGRLMEAPVVAGQWDESMLDLRAENVANFAGSNCSIDSFGQLCAGLFSGRQVARPNISAQLSQACLVRAQRVAIPFGRLMSFAVDLPAVAGGEVSLSMDDVANVNSSSLIINRNGGLLSWAISSTGALSEGARVGVNLSNVASVEAVDAVVESNLLGQALRLTQPVSGRVVLALHLSKVGVLRGQSMRLGDQARLAIYMASIAIQATPAFSVDSSLSIQVSRSFNIEAAGDLVYPGGFQGMAIAHFEGCNVSLSLQDSGNVDAQGNLEMMGLAIFAQRGGVRRSDCRLDVANSLNARAGGSLVVRGSILHGFFDRFSGVDIESSQIALAVMKSLLMEAQGDIVVNGADLLRHVVEQDLDSSNASMLVSDSGNINAQRNVRLLNESSVLRTVVNASLRNSSLNLTLQRSGNVVGTDVGARFFRGVVGSLLTGGASDTHLRLRAQAAGFSARRSLELVDSVVAGSLVLGRLERSELVFEASDFAGAAASDFAGVASRAVLLLRSSLLGSLADGALVNSSAHFDLLRTAEVLVLGPTAVLLASVPAQPRGLVDRLMRSSELMGSNVSVAARFVANVRAFSLSMADSGALLAGLEHSGSLAGSSVALALEDVAGFTRGRRLDMRRSTLLGTLFSHGSQEVPMDVRLRAQLDFSANVEVSEAALLEDSSLLGPGGAPTLELRSTALACRTQRSAGALLTSTNGTLCAGGVEAQAVVAESSCIAQLCEVKF